MDCMKREMHSWDRERRARRFALGCVLVLVGVVVMGVVQSPLVSYGAGGAMLATGIALVGREGQTLTLCRFRRSMARSRRRTKTRRVRMLWINSKCMSS
jgi:hypothetical protein